MLGLNDVYRGGGIVDRWSEVGWGQKVAAGGRGGDFTIVEGIHILCPIVVVPNDVYVGNALKLKYILVIFHFILN